jgi:hypothetical protein
MAMLTQDLGRMIWAGRLYVSKRDSREWLNSARRNKHIADSCDQSLARLYSRVLIPCSCKEPYPQGWSNSFRLTFKLKVDARADEINPPVVFAAQTPQRRHYRIRERRVGVGGRSMIMDAGKLYISPGYHSPPKGNVCRFRMRTKITSQCENWRVGSGNFYQQIAQRS